MLNSSKASTSSCNTGNRARRRQNGCAIFSCAGWGKDMSGTKIRSDDELAQLLDDVVMVSDRKFFIQHPGREFRIRPAWEIEVEQIARVNSSNVTAQPIADDHCWWTLVWQVSPGMRMRHLFSAPHDLDPEPPEAVAHSIWNQLTHNEPAARRFRKDARAIRMNDKGRDSC